MRRHAKASTAGSTMRQAGRLGRIFRGALATRGSSLGVKGSSAPSTKRLVLPLGIFIAILAAMALVVATAGATKIHSFKEVFGSAAQPSFGDARGIAIEQPTGDLLVIDASDNSIKRFNADGSADNFSATGTNVIDGAGAGDETPQGGLGFSSASESQIAVDNSGGATDGNIYVTQSFPNAINVFAKTGAYLGQLSAAGVTGFSEACGVAVDPAGVVYVGDYSSGIHRFAPAANPPVNADHTATFTTVANPCTLAAGAGASAGFLFAAQYLGPISKLDSGTGELKYVVSADSHTTLTVDPGTGHVYGATGSSVKELDASGASSATVVATISTESTVQGVAVRGASGDVFLSRSGTANIEVFNGALTTVPDVAISPATNNTGTTATLNGTVNPDGVELSQCEFEYGKTTAYGGTVPCAESPAAIGSGTSPVAVHADISGLAPNETTYNFRLLAANPQASANSSNQSFKTPNTVVTTAASGVSANAATLNGTVNPAGVAMTECLFEWGTTTSYGQTAPCVPSAAGIGTGTSPVPVSAALSGLDPGTTYHFRLKAANGDGPMFGQDLSFATLGPVIAATWTEDVVFTEATLKAEINPEGLATTYRFEYGPTPAYGEQTPEIAVGSDSSFHEVTRFISGLSPDTTYHYRVVATNGDGSTQSSDHTFTTYEPFAPKTDCANQTLRYGPSAKLPDCRAYEMVSPVDKAGGDILAPPHRGIGSAPSGWYKSAPDGNKITYTAMRAFGDQSSGQMNNQYIASRGASGWSSHGINAPQGTTLQDPDFNETDLFSPLFGFSSDLSSAWMISFNVTPLAPGGREGFPNLYRRDNLSDSYEALTTLAPLSGSASYRPIAVSFSADGSKSFYTVDRQLTPDAAAGSNRQLYEFSNGELELISVLPGGSANTEHSDLGAPDGANDFNLPRIVSTLDGAVSADGSRVFWTSIPAGSGGPGKIYVRIDGETTVAISESVTTEPSRFWTATSDGSKALFSVAGFDALKGNLYLFDVDTQTPTLIAGNIGGVAGAADDLSHVYFTSTEVLAPGGIAGEKNLYLYAEGTHTFIARPGFGVDLDDPRPFAHTARVTADGRHLVFMSRSSLTGYDNADATTGQAAAEVFLYDADSNELLCASCNPSGARPESELVSEREAAWIPRWEWALNELHPLSADGNRVFFNARDALVPHDTNGVQDVYQWEAPGTGSCHIEAPEFSELNGGCVSLISTGQSPDKSEFRDAGAGGEDVFFVTKSSIGPEDPGLIDLYDARVGGGYPRPALPPPCVGDACQSVPSAPDDPTPASAAFRGAGNPAPRRSCRVAAKRAAKLSRQAKQARRQGKRQRASRLSKQAKRLSRGAVRCRRANGGAGR